MHPLDENPAVNREPNHLPGFLFPSQIAALMLVETEDLILRIAPILWLIFGAVMALRYPTQDLRAAADSPTLAILHLVISDGSQRGPAYQRAISSFAVLRPPRAYTVIKDRKQVEHNFVSIIRARARCALPLPMEFHPVAWLHIPINPETGAALSFADWNAEVVLRVLATIVQRLGGRERGEEPSELRYPYVCDTSRVYCDRTSPRAYPARQKRKSKVSGNFDVFSSEKLQLFSSLLTVTNPLFSTARTKIILWEILFTMYVTYLGVAGGRLRWQ